MPRKSRKGTGGVAGAGAGPGTGTGPVLTAADVSLATAKSEELYTKLNEDISENRPISKEDLINYLLNTYNTQRIGLQSVVLPGLGIFLDNYVIGTGALQGTSQFCQELFGFKSTEFRELLTRGSGNVTQCGKGGYKRNLPLVCIWCGEPIYDMAECEHSLPITPCAGLLGFSSNPDRPKIEHLLEYGYAHRLCNQVKLDVPFLTWSDTDKEWIINWGNMSEVYDKISRSGPRYKNAQLLAYYLDKKTGKLINTLGTDITNNNDAVGAPYVPDVELYGNYDLRNPADIRNRNNLTEGGEHRNKVEIRDACEELATLTAALKSGGDTLAGGAKQKKSKKKQRGGVLHKSTSACELDLNYLNDETELQQYLSQDLRLPFGKKWLTDKHDSKFYGPYRMKLIEAYCNTYTKLLEEPNNIKYTVLARIVTSPRPKDLAETFSASLPANPVKEAEDAKQLLQLVLLKKIRNFNTYNFNIGSIINLRPRAQAKKAKKEIPALEYLKQEKLRQFNEIEQLIDDHNKKHPSRKIERDIPLDDGTEIPVDANSKIDKIEQDIIDLTSLTPKGGVKLRKMKGGMREAFYGGPEISKFTELILSYEEGELAGKDLEVVEPLTYFYSIKDEPLEVYNQINKKITNEIIRLVQVKEAEDTQILITDQEDKVTELVEKLINIKEFFPELDSYNREGITLEQKSIIFAAIIFTNVSKGIEYSQVEQLINDLDNLFFGTQQTDFPKSENLQQSEYFLEMALKNLREGRGDVTDRGEVEMPLRASTTGIRRKQPYTYVFPKPDSAGFFTPENKHGLTNTGRLSFPPAKMLPSGTNLSSKAPPFSQLRPKKKNIFSGGSRKKITINRKNTKKLNKRKN